MAATTALPAQAAGETTTIGFDDLPLETVVGKQYAPEGLELGTAVSFGQKGLAAGDCGSPKVKAGPSPSFAFSPPNFALLNKCGDPAGPSSGTYGKLLGQPRGSLSVEVRSLAVGSVDQVTLTGYNAAGEPVASAEPIEVGPSAWSGVSIKLPGAAKTISYFSIITTKPTEDEIAIDDVSFESEPTSTSPPPPKQPPPPPPISANIASLTPSPLPGSVISLTGAGSQPGSGRIISYDWDLNGDGKIDTSTGTNPVVQLILAPGLHTVDLTVTNSNKETSKSSIGVNVPFNNNALHAPDGGEGECTSTYDQGQVHVIAECIQKQKGGGVVISSRQVALDGMDLTTTSNGPGVFKIETIKLLGIGNTVQMSGAPVNVELLNTPIGNVVLGGRDLEKEPITLAFEAFVPPKVKLPLSARLAHARAHAAGGGKTLVMAFAVAHKCASGSKKAGCCPPQNNTSCAELPGSFPLTGQVAVYLNDKGQSLIDVQVGLELKSVNFEATGALEIIADRETGIDLESLKFEIGEAGLAEIFVTVQVGRLRGRVLGLCREVRGRGGCRECCGAAEL
ncbi:MAG: PKD domain-containing protein [Solirubrobacteraceae bacterium]